MPKGPKVKDSVGYRNYIKTVEGIEKWEAKLFRAFRALEAYRDSRKTYERNHPEYVAEHIRELMKARGDNRPKGFSTVTGEDFPSTR